jgi:hypothetical protein
MRKINDKMASNDRKINLCKINNVSEKETSQRCEKNEVDKRRPKKKEI